MEQNLINRLFTGQGTGNTQGILKDLGARCSGLQKCLMGGSCYWTLEIERGREKMREKEKGGGREKRRERGREKEEERARSKRQCAGARQALVGAEILEGYS